MANPITQRFLADVKMLHLRFPVAAIAKRTGFSKSNVSKYLNGADPSDNFIKKFYAEYFPESGITADMILYEPQAEYSTKDDLIESLRQHIKTQETLIATLQKQLGEFEANSSQNGKRTHSG